MTKVLIITGPTASGKSRLALDLAGIYPIEIISADSMQIYRHMDIGTDKATPEERAAVTHHLIDIKDPGQPWSVEEFQQKARRAIDDIVSRGHLPCIVGGTGFYIRALLYDFPLEDAPPDPEFRRKMNQLAKVKGNQAIYEMLKDFDPESYQALHPNDVKRVIRAIEYYQATNRPISARKHQAKCSIYDAMMVGLQWKRQELYERIDNRVDEQFRRGLVDEVAGLINMGYSGELPSMQGIGYKEVYWMLKGLTTEAETKAVLKRNTRRFAKRQFTWFAKEEGIIWLPFGKHTSWTNLINQVRNLVDNWLLANTCNTSKKACDMPEDNWRELT